ncbi:MAG: (2Fe-2S)-binding protein, partial [Acetobacterales bacterium]
GRLDAARRDSVAADWRTALRRELRLRPFLDALYRPADGFRVPDDDVLACRCEEITAGEIRRMVRLGASGPNQLKAFTRAGMGPCQGRLCGLTVCETIAAERGVPPSEVGYYRLRPPIKPMTLGALAGMAAPRVAADADPDAAPARPSY